MRIDRQNRPLQAVVLAVSAAIVSLGAQAGDVTKKDAFVFDQNGVYANVSVQNSDFTETSGQHVALIQALSDSGTVVVENNLNIDVSRSQSRILKSLTGLDVAAGATVQVKGNTFVQLNNHGGETNLLAGIWVEGQSSENSSSLKMTGQSQRIVVKGQGTETWSVAGLKGDRALIEATKLSIDVSAEKDAGGATALELYISEFKSSGLSVLASSTDTAGAIDAIKSQVNISGPVSFDVNGVRFVDGIEGDESEFVLGSLSGTTTAEEDSTGVKLRNSQFTVLGSIDLAVEADEGTALGFDVGRSTIDLKDTLNLTVNGKEEATGLLIGYPKAEGSLDDELSGTDDSATGSVNSVFTANGDIKLNVHSTSGKATGVQLTRTKASMTGNITLDIVSQESTATGFSVSGGAESETQLGDVTLKGLKQRARQPVLKYITHRHFRSTVSRDRLFPMKTMHMGFMPPTRGRSPLETFVI